MLAAQPMKVVSNGLRLHRGRIKHGHTGMLCLLEGLKLPEIRSVVAHGFLRRMPLYFKKGHESLNCVINAVRSSSARCPVSRRLRSLSLVGEARGGKSPKLVFIG